MSNLSFSPLLAEADNPWRRLPWTVSVTILIWTLFLWGFGHLLGEPGGRDKDILAIDAQLMELPASVPDHTAENTDNLPQPALQTHPQPTNAPLKEEVTRHKPSTVSSSPSVRQETKKAAVIAGPAPSSAAEELAAKSSTGADSAVPPADALTPRESTKAGDSLSSTASTASSVGSQSRNAVYAAAGGATGVLPSVINGPPPAYPKEARAQGLTGKVRVKVLISEEGTVKDTLIALSSGYAILDNAARQGLHCWLFNPAFRDGRAVAAWVVVPVLFKLE